MSIVKLMIERLPATLSMANQNGELPLHCALKHKCRPPTIKLMVNLYQDGARSADHEGRLPLHCAVERYFPFETFEVVLNAYPGAVERKDNRNRNALFMACTAGASLDIIFALTEQQPETVVDAMRRWYQEPQE